MINLYRQLLNDRKYYKNRYFLVILYSYISRKCSLLPYTIEAFSEKAKGVVKIFLDAFITKRQIQKLAH